MNRRTLIIIASIIVLIGLAVALYFLFFNKPSVGVGPNPFGSAGDKGPTVEPVDTGVPVQDAGYVAAPRLLKLADGPVAKGFVLLYTPPVLSVATTSNASSTTPSITTPAEVEARYVERQSGNIYGFKIHERSATRLSNKTLPGIQEASWLADGSRAFVRFLEADGAGGEHISTYLLPVDGEGGYFLEQNMSQVTAASSSVLLLLSSGSGSIASLTSRDGTGGKTVFSSLLSSLTVAFAGSGFIATTRASLELDGYAFQVDGAGTFSRLLGPYRGLASLPSPSGKHVLYSYVDRTKLYMQVLDAANRTTVALPLTTLVEKCVWDREGAAVYCGVPTAISKKLPDEWYQGAYAFSDRMWKIDLATRVATLVFDPRQLADISMDMQGLTIDTASDVIIFMNKSDGSLWSYDL